jgi:hypothetical protein
MKSVGFKVEPGKDTKKSKGKNSQDKTIENETKAAKDVKPKTTNVKTKANTDLSKSRGNTSQLTSGSKKMILQPNTKWYNLSLPEQSISSRKKKGKLKCFRLRMDANHLEIWYINGSRFRTFPRHSRVAHS